MFLDGGADSVHPVEQGMDVALKLHSGITNRKFEYHTEEPASLRKARNRGRCRATAITINLLPDRKSIHIYLARTMRGMTGREGLKAGLRLRLVQ